MIIHKCDRCGKEQENPWKEVRIEMDTPQQEDKGESGIYGPVGSVKKYELCQTCRDWILNGIRHYSSVREGRPPTGSGSYP